MADCVRGWQEVSFGRTLDAQTGKTVGALMGFLKPRVTLCHGSPPLAVFRSPWIQLPAVIRIPEVSGGKFQQETNHTFEITCRYE